MDDPTSYWGGPQAKLQCLGRGTVFHPLTEWNHEKTQSLFEVSEEFSGVQAVVESLDMLNALHKDILEVEIAKNSMDEFVVANKFLSIIQNPSLRQATECNSSSKVLIAVDSLQESLVHAIQTMIKPRLAALIQSSKSEKEKLEAIQKIGDLPRLPDELKPLIPTLKLLVSKPSIPELKEEMKENEMVEALKFYQKVYAADLSLMKDLSNESNDGGYPPAALGDFGTKFEETFKKHVEKWSDDITEVTAQVNALRQAQAIV